MKLTQLTCRIIFGFGEFVIWVLAVRPQKRYVSRDVTIIREPVENQFKHVMIKIGWDTKRITIQLGVGVYRNLLSLEKFRWYFLFSSASV